MPKVPQAHLDARRSGILKAAFRCFSRNGLHTTRMKDICRAANLSPGAVYSYFDSKQELIEALARESRDRLVRFVSESSEEPGSDQPGDRLRGLLEAVERPESADRIRLDIALWAEGLRTAEVGEILRQGGDRLRESLAGDSGDKALEARIAVALFEGFSLQKALDPELELGPLIDVIVSLLPSSRS